MKTKYIPVKGDIFEWMDTKYLCINGNNISGKVKSCGNSPILIGFVWDFDKDFPCKFIRKATKKELKNRYFDQVTSI